MSPNWTRGRARFSDGWIVIDEPEEYGIYGEKDLPFDLANIRDTHDAVEFAEKHGLLKTGPGSSEYQELFSEWQEVSTTIAGLMRLYVVIVDAVAGSQDANKKLWTLADTFVPLFQAPASSDFEVQCQASAFLAAGINEGLKGVEQIIVATVEFDDGQPGRFAFGVEPPNLIGIAYHSFSMHIVNSLPMRQCEECGQAFLVHDQRQRYCGTKCSNRARYTRWSENKKKQNHRDRSLV